MATPQIPESNNNSSIEQAMADLLNSVAAEEFAIASLITSTAKTIEALAYMISNPGLCPQTKNITTLCKSINNTLETVAMKEWMLSKKLDNIFEIHNSYNRKRKK